MNEIRLEAEQGGAVRRITLNRPEKRNALTREMFDELTAAFEREPPEAERLTLVAAEGPAFCGGVDLGERADNPSGEGESPLELLCEAVRRYPLPVIAVVHGHAIGGGLMLALHCDFVVAVQDALLGNGAVQMGLAPPWSPARRVAEVTGPVIARELLLLGDPVPAERLADAHVIAAAVAQSDLPATVDRLVDRLVLNAPLSLRAVKATLTAQPFEAVPHAKVSAMIARAQGSADAREGVSARRERRASQFVGR